MTLIVGRGLGEKYVFCVPREWKCTVLYLSFVYRAPSTTAIFNRNRDFQRQPRPNYPCMGSGNRNHHHDLQIAVAVAVDLNFLIFGGRSLKSRLRLLWCMGRSDQILSVVPLKNNAIFARSSESRSDIVENCDSTEKD